VRRDWLRTLLTRKTPPKGTAGFVAAALACELLGLPASTYGRNDDLAGYEDDTHVRASPSTTAVAGWPPT
jgi:hypothetical protein